MAKPPTITDLNKRGRKRAATVKKAQKGLLEKAGITQDDLFDVSEELLKMLERDENGNLKITNFNLKKINKATILKGILDEIDEKLNEYYEAEFEEILLETAEYFNPFKPTPNAVERIDGRSKIITGGFLNGLFDNNQIKRSIQQTLTKGVTSGQNITDIQSALTDQIKGKGDKLGLVQGYHYQNGFNELKAHSRALDNEFSKTLNLNYAIYQGGEKTTSREFCLNRLGGVYNREEILQWNHTPATWSGRMENNDILIDLGGWNCGHKLGWITYELAKRMNPANEKSKYDEK